MILFSWSIICLVLSTEFSKGCVCSSFNFCSLFICVCVCSYSHGFAFYDLCNVSCLLIKNVP